MRRVATFARLAESIAFDRLGENHGRRTLVMDCRIVRREHLSRIVSAAAHLQELFVRKVLRHGEQFGRNAEKVLANVSARLNAVFLILAVDDFAHAFDEPAVDVGLEQFVPVGPPDHLDAVPAGAAEGRLQLLDDLAVATDRTVEPLQVAVDHEGQIVEPFARRQGQRAEAFRLVGFAVADKAPDTRVARVENSAVPQIAEETRLIDRRDRAQPHRDGGELPEVGHQPGVRIRREPMVRAAAFAAKMLEILFGQAPFDERPRVHAGRGMSLEINEVAGVRLVPRVKEMIQADFVKRRGRSKRRNVAADAGIFRVGPRDHGHRVPANDALDPPLDFDVAGIARLLVGRNRVDVRSIRGEGERDAPEVGPFLQVDEQFLKSLRSVANQDVVEGLEPFFELVGLNAGHIVGHEAFAHET